MKHATALIPSLLLVAFLGGFSGCGKINGEVKVKHSIEGEAKLRVVLQKRDQQITELLEQNAMLGRRLYDCDKFVEGWR